jgi:rhomboid protease GluP
MIGRLLVRGVDAGISLLDALGARGSRWEWRKRAWQRAAEEKAAAWDNVRRGTKTTIRMCRSCRALVEGGGATCPSCGASMSGVPKGGLPRLLGLLFPGRPSMSVVLLSANVLLFAIVVLLDTPQLGPVNALWSPSLDRLIALGAKVEPLMVRGQWWRVVTANFLHGGVLHIFMNSLALATLGPLIEESFGSRRLFVIYFISGVAGFSLSALLRPQWPSVGASAAIYGLLAFAFVYSRLRGGPSARALSDQLMRWLLYGVIMFFIPGIDNYAHLGGVLAGGALGLVFDPGPPRTAARRALLWSAFAVCVALTIVAFALMMQAYPEIAWQGGPR